MNECEKEMARIKVRSATFSWSVESAQSARYKSNDVMRTHACARTWVAKIFPGLSTLEIRMCFT